MPYARGMSSASKPPYNYPTFDLAREDPPFHAFKNMLHVGTKPPSYPLTDLATDEPRALKKLWRTEVAILEFGSFT